jgi:hypothetical protein
MARSLRAAGPCRNFIAAFIAAIVIAWLCATFDVSSSLAVSLFLMRMRSRSFSKWYALSEKAGRRSKPSTDDPAGAQAAGSMLCVSNTSAEGQQCGKQMQRPVQPIMSVEAAKVNVTVAMLLPGLRFPIVINA